MPPSTKTSTTPAARKAPASKPAPRAAAPVTDLPNALFLPPAAAASAPPEPEPDALFAPPAAAAPPGDLMNPPFPAHLSYAYELITPEIAVRELDRMHVNRSKSKINAEVLESALRAGRWYPDICVTFVDADGCYWDCMHRLIAIENTGIPAWILVIRGVREEAAECIDTGRPRTYKDWLRMQGESWYVQRGALARLLAIREKYGIEGVRNPPQAAVANWEMDAWLHRPGIEESLKLADSIRRVRGLKKANPTVIAYMVMVTGAGTDPTGFWRSVRDGEDLKKDDPAKTLREFIMGGAQFIIPTEVRLAQLYACAVAWNKHVKGESYPFIRPSYAYRANGTDKYFPSRNVPDVLPLDYDKHAELKAFAEVFQALRSSPGQPALTAVGGE